MSPRTTRIDYTQLHDIYTVLEGATEYITWECHDLAADKDKDPISKEEYERCENLLEKMRTLVDELGEKLTR